MWRIFQAHINSTMYTSTGIRSSSAHRETKYTTYGAISAAVIASLSPLFPGYTVSENPNPDKKEQHFSIREHQYSTFDTSTLKPSLSSMYPRPTSLVHCEESSQRERTIPSQNASSTNDLNVTFRQRRLTMNKASTKINLDELENEEDEARKASVASKRLGSQEKRARILYSSEIDEGEEMYSRSVLVDTEDGEVSYSTSENIEPPFPPHKVGTFSCHGIEPQPYVIYVAPDNESNGEESPVGKPSLFSRMFGTYAIPRTDNNRKKKKESRQTRIITMTEKKINQDRGMVIYPYLNYGDQKSSNKRTALFGAFDGHGEQGEYLAEYTMNALSEKLQKHPLFMKQGNGSSMVDAFHDTFLEIDEELKDIELLKPSHSGSTACVVLLQDMKIWVANIGDSRAVLARKNDTVTSKELLTIELTKDHNASDEMEKQRIIRSGGFVTPPQGEGLPSRIWLDHECTQIGLAMSRSIGDHALKDVGVIADPVVQEYELSENDQFFLIATDGVWEFISSEEAVSIIQNCFDKGLGSSDACQELIRIAMDKWKEKEGDYRDDITAIVVRIGGLWEDN